MALFHLDMPSLRRKSTGTLSGKAPALPHASGNPVESSSLDTPVETCSLDVVAVFTPKSIDWSFEIPGFSKIWTSTEAVVVDVCCSSFKRTKQRICTWQGRTMKRSTTKRAFSAIPATFKLKENKQGPNLNLTDTSHPLYTLQNLFVHSRPSNS